MRAVMQLVTLRRAAAVAVWYSVLARPSSAQQRDTTAPPRDSLKVYTLPPAVVSVTRANPPISKIPLAVHLVDKTEISRARPTWGLDEALDRKSTRLNSSHLVISYAVFCLKKKKT